jgi:organic radical activating enzyme
MKVDCKTFCSAPWFALRVHQSGNMVPCYRIDPKKSQFEGKTDYDFESHTLDEWFDSDYSKYLKQQLTSGIQISECDDCWIRESRGEKSLRNQTNDMMIPNHNQDFKKTWAAAYFKNKKDFDHDLLICADVKVSNVCNFSCGMCNPGDSSQIANLWNANKNHPAVVYRINQNPNTVQHKFQGIGQRPSKLHERLETILATQPRFLKIIGGEPLLDKHVIKILQNVSENDKSKITLSFCTNGSADLTTMVKKTLAGYKKIFFVVSLEGVGPVQEWARKGSDWSKVSQNIDCYLDNIDTPLTVSYTQQAMTIAHYADLAKWCRDRNIQMENQTVLDPDYLGLAVMPDSIRQIAQQNLMEVKPCFIDDIYRSPHQSNLLKPLKTFLDFYDPSQKWRDIFPEWQDVFTSHAC